MLDKCKDVNQKIGTFIKTYNAISSLTLYFITFKGLLFNEF